MHEYVNNVSKYVYHGSNVLFLGVLSNPIVTGASFAMNSHSIFFEYSRDSENTVYCMGIYTESRGGIIGSNAMRDHDVIFDPDNKRVGFAQVCRVLLKVA